MPTKPSKLQQNPGDDTGLESFDAALRAIDSWRTDLRDKPDTIVVKDVPKALSDALREPLETAERRKPTPFWARNARGVFDALLSRPSCDEPGYRRYSMVVGGTYNVGARTQTIQWPAAVEAFREALRGDAAELAAVALGAEAAPTAPGLDGEAIEILRCLAKRDPQLSTYDDIESGARVGRKTVSDRLKLLIRAGLAGRPNGKKKGAKITPAGVAALEKCGARPGPAH